MSGLPADMGTLASSLCCLRCNCAHACTVLQVLSKAVAYIQQNELTKWIKIVYVYEDLNDPIIRVLAENLRVIDRCYPKVLDLSSFTASTSCLVFVSVCPVSPRSCISFAIITAGCTIDHFHLFVSTLCDE